MNDVAAIITAIALVINAIGTYLNGRRIVAVKEEVKTMNSQTIAELADASETRRIGKIPKMDRTKLEKSHIKESKKRGVKA
jgi:hypothetical protein